VVVFYFRPSESLVAKLRSSAMDKEQASFGAATIQTKHQLHSFVTCAYLIKC